MKPNIKFLQKVAEGRVRHVFGYSMKRGGYWVWRGGEATSRKHAAAGFVELPNRGPSLGKPALVTLTESGRAALSPSDRGSRDLSKSTTD